MLRHYFDGLDLASEGIFLGGDKGGKITGWLSAPAIERDESPLDGYGSVLADVDSMSGRPITVPVSVAPLAGTAAAHRTAVDLLNSFLGDWVWCRLEDGVTAREVRGLVTEVLLEPTTPGAPIASAGRVVMRCPDPRWRALEPTCLSLSIARLAIVTGSGRIDDWTLRFMNPGGAVTDPAARIRDRTGELRTTLTVPGSLATSDHIELLAARGLAQKWSAGVATSVLATLTGAFVPLCPGDTVELAAASGTPSGELFHHVQDW